MSGTQEYGRLDRGVVLEAVKRARDLAATHGVATSLWHVDVASFTLLLRTDAPDYSVFLTQLYRDCAWVMRVALGVDPVARIMTLTVLLDPETLKEASREKRTRRHPEEAGGAFA